MQRIPFQDLRKTGAADMEAYIKAASDVLRSGWYINGASVKKFESEMARSCGAAYCVAVSTGLDALRLILMAYITLGRLKEGDEVIVPANTFIATFLAVTSCGLTAVAADVSEDDYCLDLGRLPLTDKTRAIIPVHLYGNPCWDKAAFSRLRDNGILIIEDNAQAIGAEASAPGFNGNCLTGNLADAAAISFYPAKNIGAFGDAGAVTTNDSLLAQTIRKLANYGSGEKYHHELQGLNCRMDEIQAAMLSVKLAKLNEINDRRRKNAELYDILIKNPFVTKPRVFTDRKQVWHQYVIRHPLRDELRKYLDSMGIGTEIHYPVPCHRQKCYEGSEALKTPVSLANAEKFAGEIISLPIADITEEEIKYIADSINSYS